MIPIEDLSEVEKLERLKVGIIQEPAHLMSSWLVSKGWIVVPVESAGHFLEKDAECLSRAFQKMGHVELFAIATEEVVEDFPRCFLVDTSEADLMEFSQKCAHFNFALLPADRSVAVLCTTEYFLVAGPVEFAAVAVAGDIAGAWKAFHEAAANSPWLEGIAKRYEPTHPLTS